MGPEADPRSRVRRLAEVTGASLDANRVYDWEAMEASLGVSLPEDYKIMAESFPGGWFRMFAEVMPPHSSTMLLGPHSRGVSDALRNLKNGNYAGSEFPFSAFPDPGGLLMCGDLRCLGYIFWRVISGDPAEWTIILADEEFVYWEEFNGSLSEFLLEVASGRFDASGFIDEFKWEGQSHVDIPSRPIFEWDDSCGGFGPTE